MKIRGFASETLPSTQHLKNLRAPLINAASKILPDAFLKRVLLGRLSQAIQDFHGTKEKYSVFGFGKWVYHEEQVKEFLRGNVYEVTPITAEFVPTLECNFSCALCTYRKWKKLTDKERGKRFMDFELMKHILRELKSAGVTGVKGIIWTGGGEPTLHPRLLDGMQFAKELELENGLFTNGSLLTKDPRMIERLLFEIAPAFIRVSLNAPSPGVHKTFHGYKCSPKVFFPHILNALEEMARIKLKFDKELSTVVGIGALVGQRNVESLRQFGQLTKNLLTKQHIPVGKLDYLAFRPEVVYGGKDKEQHSLEIFQKARSYFYGDIVPSLSGIRRIKSIKPIKPIFIENRFDDINAQDKSYPYCLAHPWRVSVAYDGKLYLCAEQDGNLNFYLGDLGHQSFKEIWFGEQRRKVIERLNRSMFEKEEIERFKRGEFNEEEIERLKQSILNEEEVERLEQAKTKEEKIEQLKQIISKKGVIQRLKNSMFQELCPPICVLTYMNQIFNQISFPLSTKEIELLEEELAILRGQPHLHVKFL